jgi:peptidoglycan/xylan/chitin deacetylase (PgdA/CDA1 family)
VGGRSLVRRIVLPVVLAVSLAPLAVVTATPAHAATPTSCPAAPSGVFRSAPGGGKTVALTFDDGPGRSTAQIINILKSAHVTATFFNLGVHEQEHPDLVRAERDAGFALGDHTWDHVELPGLSASAQASEMDRERSMQASITGMYPCLFRPPGGDYNSTTLTLARQRGMQVWNWSIDTEDWKANGSSDPYWVDRIRTRAEDASQLHPIVLLHNQVVGNPATVAALPDIIAFYKARGYRFVDLLGSTGLPTVTSISPSAGPVSPGTRVRVYGTNFTSVVSVYFGGRPGAAIHVASSTELLVTSPSHSALTVDVRVVTRHGTSPVTSRDRFTWVAPPHVSAISPSTGPTAGGTRVTVDGTDFRNVRSVSFGSAPGTAIHVVTATRLLISAPPGADSVPVVVTTDYGTSSGGPLFSYADPAPPDPPPTSVAPPVVTS